MIAAVAAASVAEVVAEVVAGGLAVVVVAASAETGSAMRLQAARVGREASVVAEHGCTFAGKGVAAVVKQSSAIVAWEAEMAVQTDCLRSRSSRSRHRIPLMAVLAEDSSTAVVGTVGWRPDVEVVVRTADK